MQRRQADDNAAEAQIEALVGRAESLRPTQRDTAALLAVEAYRLADTPRTRSALLATFTADPTFYDAHRLEGDVGGAGIVMPDGESAYLVDDKGRLRPYGLDTGSLGDPLPTIGDTAAGGSVLTASADGRWLAQAWRSDLDDGPTTVAVFDTSTGSLRFPPLTVDGAVWSAAFTADASELAVAIGEEARLLVVDSATGGERVSAPGVIVPALGGESVLEPQSGGVGPTPRPPAVALAGDELLLGAADGSLRAFDAMTFELRRRIALAPDTLASIRPLDDGTLLTAGRRGIARVDPGTGRVLWQHDQGLADTGDSASGATCAHLAVIEPQDAFYCANAYGQLAEHDLGSGYAIGSSTPRTATAAPVARRGRHRTGQLRRQRSRRVTLAPRRLGADHPPRRPRIQRMVVQPGRRPPTRRARRGARRLPQPGHRRGVRRCRRPLDGLINADWLDDDTVIGALFNDDGQVETAHIDLHNGDLVADGFVVDPIPKGPGWPPARNECSSSSGTGPMRH